MLTDEYHEYFMGRTTNLPLAKKIVYDIIADLGGRKGIGDEWDQVDHDIKEEILQTLIDIVQDNLDKESA